MMKVDKEISVSAKEGKEKTLVIIGPLCFY